MAKRRPVTNTDTEGRSEDWGTPVSRPPRPPVPGSAEAIAARPPPPRDYGEVRAAEDRRRDAVKNDVARYREDRQSVLHTEPLESVPRGKAKIRMDGDSSQPRPDRGPGGAVSD